MIRGNGFMAISYFIFMSPKIGGGIYTNFSVFIEWIIWVIEGSQRLARVWEIRKMTEFPELPLVKSCLPPVDTLKEIPNE